MQLKKLVLKHLLSGKRLGVAANFPLHYCVPVYHSVSNDELAHLKHIINYKNVLDFKKDLDFLERNFQLLNWDEFKDFINGNLKTKKTPALLTFDDGLRDFTEVVAPILLIRGIFAINFINPAFIDNKDLMFRCKASLLVEKIMSSKKINPKVFQLYPKCNSDTFLLCKSVLNIRYNNQEKLNQTAKLLEVDFEKYLIINQPYLKLEELQTLHKQGFEFGAHSWDHCLYHAETQKNQILQTRESLLFLKKNGLNNESFAFPFTDYGVEKSFFEEIFEKEENLFCTFGTAGIKIDSISKNLQRIPMETGKTAEDTLKKEIQYFRLKKIIGKNKIIRI